jgi:hypothetical protein
LSIHKTALLAGLLSCSLVPATQAEEHDWDRNQIRHVLLISIDGMHAVDYLNCKNGVSGINGGASYCPALAALGETGVNYLSGSTAKPSDSFPGLMGLVSGGTPRTVGAFYDVAYDRSLDPPARTTGNGVAAGACTAGTPATGTTTEYEEGIDLDQTKLNGGIPGAALADGGINGIDPTRLPRDPKNNCAPVYPWNFVRTNTIFGVIHAAGGYTAWTDKHPSYSSVAGPGDGSNVDDYYSPEINSAVVSLPGVITPAGLSCSTVPDPSQLGAWTDSFRNIQCYDTLKVASTINQIDGKTHNGNRARVPTIFGLNFQAVSVGQKLIESGFGAGGYLDATGTPSALLLDEIQFVDKSIGNMVSELKRRGLWDSTLIVVTAKHGQSPIDPHRFFPIPGNGANGTTPANILDSAGLLPESESPSNPTGLGPTEDDLSLIWLKDSSQTDTAVAMLETDATKAGIGQIFAGASLAQMFNPPGLPPDGDPRTPDIVIAPNAGVIYTGSAKKQEEHGGFAHDDTNVMILLSNPSFSATTLTTAVETIQVAPTILKALQLDPASLEAVRKEGTAVLPGIRFNSGNR